MAVRLANSTAISAADSIVDLVDGGDLRLRTGAQPAQGDDAATGTLLATFNLPTPAYSAAADAAPHADATLQTVADTTGAAAGAAGYYEVRDSGGTVQWTGSVTATGGGGNLQLNDVNIAIGQTVQITSGTFRHLEL